jgi:NTE family protein
MYALGYRPEALADAMDRVSAASVRPTFPLRSLLSSSGMRAGLRRLDVRARFEDMPVPLAIVGADVVTGQEVVFRRGLLWQAVLASQSIPGIFPPQPIGPYMVVDGGVINPVPTNVLAQMGADIVIGVRLASAPPAAAVEAEAVEASGRAPSVLQTILRSIDIMQSKISIESAAAATILIEPVLENSPGMGLRSFRQGRRYIAVGEAAAAAALPRITAALPWLRELPSG